MVLKLSRALPGTKASPCPHFLFVQKCFSLLGFLCVPKSSFKQFLIREVRGCRKKVKVSKKQNAVIK